jgi:hypothetical protein
VFQPLLALRLRILDSCNELAEEDQDATARAWVEILELEASWLMEGDTEWAAIIADEMQLDEPEMTPAERHGRQLGLLQGRRSLIVADQVTAALIRGHLDARCT